MFIEILFKILLFKGGVLIYAEHCVYICIYIYKLKIRCQLVAKAKILLLTDVLK